ncbi:MAG: alpha-2-macroglobulin family protein [Lepagella sp.]
MAFPQTVKAQMKQEFDSALNRNDGLSALRSAIKFIYADSEISADSVMKNVNLFETIATKCSAPWSGLAYLYEAKLYSEFYGANKYAYDGRNLPLNDIPEDAALWSRPMFENKIVSLISLALNDSPSLLSTPATDARDVASFPDNLSKDVKPYLEHLSLFDVVTINAFDILSIFCEGNDDSIPFNTEASTSPVRQLRFDIIDKALSIRHDDKDLLSYAIIASCMADILPRAKAKSFVAEQYNFLSDTPNAADMLLRYCDQLADNKLTSQPRPYFGRKSVSNSDNNLIRRKCYDLLNDYRSRFPKAYCINNVSSRIADLSKKSLSVSFSSQYLPNQPVKVSVNGSGVYDFYLLVIPVDTTVLTGKKYYYGSSISFKDLKNKIKAVVPVSVADSLPSLFEKEVELPALPPGLYTCIPSTSKSLSGVLDYKSYLSVDIFNVSDISVIKSNIKGDKCILHVVSAYNQAPIPGAKVKFIDDKASCLAKTDANGRVEVPYKSCRYVVSFKDSYAYGSTYSGWYNTDRKSLSIHGSMFTDLSIYHPGDSIQFSGVIYSKDNRRFHPLSDVSVELALKDANYQEIDTLSLNVDQFGRFSGKFKLPKEGLLGNWSLQGSVCIPPNYSTLPEKLARLAGKYCTFESSFVVADYKAPTFTGVVASDLPSYKVGDKISFHGSANTYAGMPVADAKVSYVVKYAPLWWFGYGSDASYGGETITAQDGSFEITLDTKGLIGTDFERGSFTLLVTVTNAAGESQELQPLYFSLSEACHISPSSDLAMINASVAKSYNVPVYDISHHPVVKTVYYAIDDMKGERIASGEFQSPSFSPDMSKIPSGKYKLSFSLSPDFSDAADVVSNEMVVWRDNDKTPPVESPLWITADKIIAPRGDRQVSLRVGSSYDNGYILVQTCDVDTLISEVWVMVNKGFVSLDFNAPAEDSRLFINVVGMRDLKSVVKRVVVIPELQTKSLVISQESFRDHIEPGNKESWRFSFKFDDKLCPSIPVMAVMNNKALSALEPYSLSRPNTSLSWIPRLSTEPTSISSYSVKTSLYQSVQGRVFRTYPTLCQLIDYYGYRSGVRSFRYAKSAVMEEDCDMMMDCAAPCAANECSSIGAVAEKACVEMEESSVESDAQEDATPSTDLTPLRDVNNPVALFLPDLITDQQGVVSIDFEAPDFVGMWQLHLLGFTPELNVAVESLDVTSAKRVMAQLNAPRFVRTGDVVAVSATLFNNDDAPADVAGRIVICDPLTGRVIHQQEFEPLSLSPSASRVVTTSFTTPADLNSLCIKAYASIPGSSDGEQAIVPLLPASNPVLESTSFYLRPNADSFNIQLPKFTDDAVVSLTYCDNPVWECVTALPDLLMPKSDESILDILYVLYGKSVAQGIFRRFPSLLEGVQELAHYDGDSSPLVSPLERNESLKRVSLNNTPWVRDAQSQTLRMQGLVNYADQDAIASQIDNLMETIADRQNSDGGWSWCRNFKESSWFISDLVISTFGSLKNLGYLPSDAEPMVEKAIKYVDKELVKYKKEYKYISDRTLLDYIFVRDLFYVDLPNREFEKIRKDFLKSLRKKWTGFDVKDKATAAMILSRTGDKETADLILESLRQFASYTPQKGMWFDNIHSDAILQYRSLISTSRVLEAFAEIQPNDPAVDQIRQFLVVTKQTTDWGGNTSTCSAINAILSSGTDWTIPTESPLFYLNGSQIENVKATPHTGAVVIDIDPKAASGATLSLKRSGNGPAWGGVVAQWVAPILDVKAASIPQLSVEKSVYAVAHSGEDRVVSDSYKQGERLHVTITLICDRDLEYVTVNDSRAACLEPVEQISGYDAVDGVFVYKEIRNDVTNLFIPFLPKGKYVIDYECFADRTGTYSLGIATAQSQYAPEIAAHSAGAQITILP